MCTACLKVYSVQQKELKMWGKRQRDSNLAIKITKRHVHANMWIGYARFPQWDSIPATKNIHERTFHLADATICKRFIFDLILFSTYKNCPQWKRQ